MLAEYFTPYDFGGSEWSTYYLAKGLAKKSIKVTVLTPNYGKSPSEGILDNYKIVRFPFYKKIRNKKQLTPFWQTNLLWIAWTSLFTLKSCVKDNVNIIHVQGKYFLPAAIVCKLILRKKVIITLRDYIILCPMGTCLLKSQNICSFWQYFTSDVNLYFKLYMKNKNILFKGIQLLAFFRARVISQVLKSMLDFADEKVAVSTLVKTIYERAGVKGIKVIYNAIETTSIVAKQRSNEGVFAGRLTPGKGPQLIIKALLEVSQKRPDFKFIFLGEGLLKKELQKQILDLKLNKIVTFLGRVEHDKVIDRISRAKICVIPSIWPEPLSRVGLESLACSTPLVVSSNSGNAEVFKNGEWGFVVDPKPPQLSKAILLSLEKNDLLIKNLTRDKFEIKRIFSENVYKKYSQLYLNLLK